MKSSEFLARLEAASYDPTDVSYKAFLRHVQGVNFSCAGVLEALERLPEGAVREAAIEACGEFYKGNALMEATLGQTIKKVGGEFSDDVVKQMDEIFGTRNSSMRPVTPTTQHQRTNEKLNRHKPVQKENPPTKAPEEAPKEAPKETSKPTDDTPEYLQAPKPAQKPSHQFVEQKPKNPLLFKKASDKVIKDSSVLSEIISGKMNGMADNIKDAIKKIDSDPSLVGIGNKDAIKNILSRKLDDIAKLSDDMSKRLKFYAELNSQLMPDQPAGAEWKIFFKEVTEIGDKELEKVFAKVKADIESIVATTQNAQSIDDFIRVSAKMGPIDAILSLAPKGKDGNLVFDGFGPQARKMLEDWTSLKAGHKEFMDAIVSLAELRLKSLDKFLKTGNAEEAGLVLKNNKRGVDSHIERARTIEEFNAASAAIERGILLRVDSASLRWFIESGKLGATMVVAAFAGTLVAFGHQVWNDKTSDTSKANISQKWNRTNRPGQVKDSGEKMSSLIQRVLSSTGTGMKVVAQSVATEQTFGEIAYVCQIRDNDTVSADMVTVIIGAGLLSALVDLNGNPDQEAKSSEVLVIMDSTSIADVVKGLSLSGREEVPDAANNDSHTSRILLLNGKPLYEQEVSVPVAGMETLKAALLSALPGVVVGAVASLFGPAGLVVGSGAIAGGLGMGAYSAGTRVLGDALDASNPNSWYNQLPEKFGPLGSVAKFLGDAFLVDSRGEYKFYDNGSSFQKIRAGSEAESVHTGYDSARNATLQIPQNVAAYVSNASYELLEKFADDLIFSCLGVVPFLGATAKSGARIVSLLKKVEEPISKWLANSKFKSLLQPILGWLGNPKRWDRVLASQPAQQAVMTAEKKTGGVIKKVAGKAVDAAKAAPNIANKAGGIPYQMGAIGVTSVVDPQPDEEKFSETAASEVKKQQKGPRAF
jgi:hypothetical protein